MLLIDYTASEFREKSLDAFDEFRPSLQTDNVTWLHVQGDVDADTLHQLGQLFGLHRLALEDVITTGERPKVDEYDGQQFVVMAHPLVDEGGENASVRQVSLFLGRNFVISFHTGGEDPFEPVRKRLRDSAGRIRERAADYLLYALIDLVIDDGFPVLEWLGDEIETLEEEMLEMPTSANLRRLYKIKRTLVELRRALWPQREVVSRLAREDNTLVSEGTKIYFRDCYDHTIQIMDLIESYRDMANGLLDVYLSTVSYRLNEIMRVLTVIATIFIPLTFIVGLYGMNFINAKSPWAMPELRWYYGYPLVWLLMIVIAGGMLVYFRRRKWF
jgi:magnesium transporter